jgi:hypothetical protein
MGRFERFFFKAVPVREGAPNEAPRLTNYRTQNAIAMVEYLLSYGDTFISD